MPFRSLARWRLRIAAMTLIAGALALFSAVAQQPQPARSGVALELNGPLSPGVFKPIGDERYVHVVMPVRTTS